MTKLSEEILRSTLRMTKLSEEILRSTLRMTKGRP